MGKTDMTWIWAIVVLAIVGGGFWYLNEHPIHFPDLSNLLNIAVNVENQQNTPSQDQIPPPVVDSSGTNLCLSFKNLYDMFVAAGYPHPQVACTAGGGTWTCDATHAGCYNYLGTINCAGFIYDYSAFSCNSYGGHLICNAHTITCER